MTIFSSGPPSLAFTALALFACGGEATTSTASGGAGGGGGSTGGESGLAVVHEPDATQIAAGHAAFAEGSLAQGILPPQAMRHLYVAWTDNLAALYGHYTDEDAYWEAFHDRYGTVPSPFEGAAYPAGFALADDGQVGIDCLLCHAGRLEGATVIGLSNNRLDLRGFVEDLQRLPAAIEALKERNLPPPYGALVQAIPDTTIPEPYASLAVPTGAAGANDGFGLGLVTSAWYGEPPEGMHTFTGYQDAPPWWTIAHKARLYTDGSANAEGIYTMMSTLLAFGLSFAELASYLPTFEAIRHFQCSLPAPRWSEHDLPPPEPSQVAVGAELFAAHCASCHGRYDGDVFPNVVTPTAAIGTDPLREAHFGPIEAAWFNGFIPEARFEMTDTDGYLAPALTGIWASAPYLHNGSVPTLRALLDPARRPTRWRRTGDTVDTTDIGLRHEAIDAPTDRDSIEGRKVVDTTVEGMSNAGHDIGPLSAGEVDALLAYLTTL